MNELITVIVPVHNVGFFLDDCIKSILNQTYTNLEIIFSINGCTDDSPLICEKYAKTDSRIRLLYLPDSGLSYARNEGIKASTGSYITFVDSDDYIHPDFIKILYDSMSCTKADFCLCQYECVDESSHYEITKGLSDTSVFPVKSYSSSQMLNMFFCDHKTYYVTAWNKLYKRELFDIFTFPEGRNCEDECIAYKAYYNSPVITVVDAALYFYRQRQNSIMHSNHSARYVDAITAYSERTDYFIQHNEDELAGYSAQKSLYWGIIFYYSCCNYDAFAATRIKNLLHKEYEIYNKTDKNVSSILFKLYREFDISPSNARKIYLKMEHTKYYKENPFFKAIINDLRNIKNDLRFNIKLLFLKLICLNKHGIKILNTNNSIDELLNEKRGICRFGDGEETIMRGESIGFQKADDTLSKKLKEIIADENAPCYIGIPDEINLTDFPMQTRKSQFYWTWYLLSFRKHWINLINPQIIYLTVNVTRPYMRYEDKTSSIDYFNKIRTLWDNKNILIVEGKSSRLGIGNDLFSKSKIKRIICPEKDAFDKYDEIFTEICKHDIKTPVFLALGPTATVLAYELCKIGYLAYDIGHIDIEYEWMNQKTNTKVPIRNKYTNEADNGNTPKECDNKEYLSQIIAKIL